MQLNGQTLQRNKLHDLIAIMYKNQARNITDSFDVKSEYQKSTDSNQICLQSTNSLFVENRCQDCAQM